MASYASLLTGLSDPDPEVRWRAARELGNLGPAASFAVRALVNSLADEEVRATAEWALARMGAEAVEPLILAALHRPDPNVRAAAIKALRNVASGHPEAIVEALSRVLGDAAAEIRALAARYLGEMGAEAEPATEALITTLGDAEPTVRQAAALALGRVAEVRLPVIERLSAALSDGDREVRQASVGALVLLAQRERSADFLLAVNRLEQLAKSGPSEERALYRSAAAAVRVSLPVRRSWPFRSAKDLPPSEVLPRPAEPPTPSIDSLPTPSGELLDDL